MFKVECPAAVFQYWPSVMTQALCAGEVISTQDSAQRMATAAANGVRDFYVMELQPGLVIDARTKVRMPVSTGPSMHQAGHFAETFQVPSGLG